MTYSLKYKRPGQWFWRTIKNVKGDSFVTDPGIVISRLIIDENEVRYEIPVDAVFVFSKNRFFSVLAKKQAETGVEIKPKTESKPE